jgi:hypothetical protein
LAIPLAIVRRVSSAGTLGENPITDPWKFVYWDLCDDCNL